MTGIKNHRLTALLVLSVSLIAVSLTAALLTGYHSRKQYELLDSFCAELIQTQHDTEQTVFRILKEKDVTKAGNGDILGRFGYRPLHFTQGSGGLMSIAGAGFLAGGLLYLVSFGLWHKKSAARIRMLTEYLEKINTGGQGMLMEASEDEFSKLQDEIYKTVTDLYQTRDAAVNAKNNFADNLSNIAHQLKTPITAISLSVQMSRENPSDTYHLQQVEKQLNRLTHLEEALLVLSRIDAGTLTLNRASADVYTLLMLAGDNLQELYKQAGVFLDIPEIEEVTVNVDLDWTMEAVMNLMKNCMEHSPAGGVVRCSCEKNPLYVELRIQDEGKGFEKEDLPRLFERFYRGKSAKEGSIGIGLSLAKEIIEMQNGILSAHNLPEGGACFEIRFYSH